MADFFEVPVDFLLGRESSAYDKTPAEPEGAS
jgi:hypothetical protein